MISTSPCIWQSCAPDASVYGISLNARVRNNNTTTTHNNTQQHTTTHITHNTHNNTQQHTTTHNNTHHTKHTQQHNNHNNNNNPIWRGSVSTGEELPPHPGELNHALSQVGGPTQSALCRQDTTSPWSTDYGGNMEKMK